MASPSHDHHTDIPTLSPVDAHQHQQSGALLVDVRDDNERAHGWAQGAVAIPEHQLAERIVAHQPDRDREILTLCSLGKRSLRAARTLHSLGYSRVASVIGGLQAWQAAGLPITRPQGIDDDAADRYARQLQLPEVGPAGQARLAASRVVLIGAGGLGTPAALYLAGAGVGTLTLIDDDHVERSNLHRQLLHTEARIGMPKTESARQSLTARNPRIQVHTHTTRLTADNADKLLTGHDLIIDGADNFPTRYLLTAASQRLGLPMVYGAVQGHAGQVSFFDPRRDDSPCYRCLYPYPPAADDAPNCSQAGVLGVLPGLIGLLQATEALKYLLALGTPLVGRLLSVDTLTMHFTQRRLPRDPQCPGCNPVHHRND